MAEIDALWMGMQASAMVMGLLTLGSGAGAAVGLVTCRAVERRYPQPGAMGVGAGVAASAAVGGGMGAIAATL